MKAVGFYRYLPITGPEAFVDLELPQPLPRGRDILVAVKAVSVNPVDTKIRIGVAPADDPHGLAAKMSKEEWQTHVSKRYLWKRDTKWEMMFFKFGREDCIGTEPSESICASAGRDAITCRLRKFAERPLLTDQNPVSITR